MAKDEGQKILDRGMSATATLARKLERLAVEYVPIDSIKPNKYNPNRQTPKDFELLCRSMKEDGFTQPIVVQKSTMEIVDGEHRWRAGRHMGLSMVPVVLVDMTDEQMRISTLRHNRARGSEDVELGAAVLRDLRELGALDWAQDSLMLNDEELQRLMDDVSAPSALAGEEYSDGWSPTKAIDEERNTPKVREAMSDAAKEMTEKLQERMRTAKSQAEVQQVEKIMRKEVYRINLVFQNNEASVVQRALEPKPAQRLLALCRQRLAVQEQQEQEQAS